jgi:hypothetical protein
VLCRTADRNYWRRKGVRQPKHRFTRRDERKKELKGEKRQAKWLKARVRNLCERYGEQKDKAWVEYLGEKMMQQYVQT